MKHRRKTQGARSTVPLAGSTLGYEDNWDAENPQPSILLNKALESEKFRSWIKSSEKPPRSFCILFALVIATITYFIGPYDRLFVEIFEHDFSPIRVEVINTAVSLNAPLVEAHTFITSMSRPPLSPSVTQRLILGIISFIVVCGLLWLSHPTSILLYLFVGSIWTTLAFFLFEYAELILPGVFLFWSLGALALAVGYEIRSRREQLIDECLDEAIPSLLTERLASYTEFQVALVDNLEGALVGRLRWPFG